jgi:hypothetical protein
MKATLAQGIDQFLREGQFIVTSFDIQKDRSPPCLAFQLAHAENQRSLSDSPRCGEQQVSPVLDFPLQSGEIAGAVKEIVVFNGRAGDISHDGHRS